jgi:hypothetical protein
MCHSSNPNVESVYSLDFPNKNQPSIVIVAIAADKNVGMSKL